MDKFITSIKEKYRERLINREEQWPPCHSDKLVRLELVERKKGEGYSANTQRGQSREDKDVKRTPLPYSNLFKVESGKRPVRKVLVEGDAGIGKTTLSISVSEDWANGKLFQQFELVLHLPLRMKVVASAGSLPELLKLLHSSPRVCESVARYLEEEEGKSVLIIADGWDELSESERQRGSFLYQLLFESFPFISVVVTSRPSASAPFHRHSCIDRFVEIQGFSKENIKAYIESEFPSDQGKAISLLGQLENNPLVESVCSVPLNCTIVCHLWRTLEEALPTTMTELYTKIILNVVLRNIQKAGAHKHILTLSKFDALPSGLQESWWLLCKFAYQALKKYQIVFSQEELTEFFPQGLELSEKILCFGLLQSTESIFDIGRGVSFHFLHLTFQEYLAALHLVKLLVDKQSSQPILDHKVYDLQKHIAIVWRFFFGIYFNVVGCTDCASVTPYLSYIRDELVSCHCAFEARNAIIEDYIIYSLKQRYLILCGDTAHDCAAVLYVIDKMQEGHIKNISFGNCQESQIRILTNSLCSKDGKLQIEGLHLRSNKLTCESIGNLLHRASSAFQSLRRLFVRFNTIESESIMTMLAKPPCRVLSNLNLSGNNLVLSGLQALENVIGASWLANLKDLNLSGCLTDNADTNAAALETFLKSLSAHCPRLDKLNLSDNDLGAPGASTLAIAISQHNNLTLPHERESLWLKSISLNNTKLGDEGLFAFIEKLESPYSFDNLYLQNNDIHATGLTCLAVGLDNMACSGEFDWDHNYNLLYCHDLDLGDNPLGIEGIDTIGDILINCDQFRVDLSRCHLTTALENIGNHAMYGVMCRNIGQQLCQMPKTLIGILTLDGNCFTGERIHILAGFVHLCEFLAIINSRDCNITSDDLIRLLDIIAESKVSYPDLCNKLHSWGLDDNKINDRGVTALTDHVTSLFPNLGKEDKDNGVHLDGNPVSMERVKILEKMLHPLIDNSW